MSSDGIEEALEGQFRTVTTAAARVIEQIARARQQRDDELERLTRSTASEDRKRYAAERETARAELAQTHNTDWWDVARPETVAHAVATADAWADRDPSFQLDSDRLHHEIDRRYSPHETPTAPDTADAQVERAKADEQLTASQLLAEEHRADVAEDLRDGHIDDGPHEEASAEASSDAYDSSERRRERADRMAGAGVDATLLEVAGRADLAEGRSAADAVARPGGRPTVRKSRRSPLIRSTERQR